VIAPRVAGRLARARVAPKHRRERLVASDLLVMLRVGATKATSSMRNPSYPYGLRRAWTVCRLTGSLHFPARRANVVGYITWAATTSLFAASPSRQRRVASFVVETASVVGSPSHVHCLLKGFLNCDDRRDESSPTHRNARWHRKDNPGMADPVCARHFSSPSGVRQRLTAWQLTGRLSNARNISARAADR
jgi:hypothetical protein